MPKSLTPVQLKQLAHEGAKARLAQLEAERSMLLRAFPGLESGRRAVSAAANRAETSVRRRRQMSAAERRAVSARMKAYWAKRRAKKD